MTTYIIPNIDNSPDKTITITKTEAKWIKDNIPEVELALVGWLDQLDSADVIAIVTQDLREVSGVTQATRTRLRQMQLIHCQADPMSYAVSLKRWHLAPLLQEHLNQTRENVTGADSFIHVKLERTGTNWAIAPLYFNQFRRRLIDLVPTKPKTVKLPALKPSPDWSFTPAPA